MIEPVKLIGAWTLVKHGRFDQLGKYYPTGEKMNGQLNYGPDGSMSVLITKIPEPLQLNDLIVYAGSFSVDGNKVSHHIKISPDLKRRNTIEIRSASFHGDDLVLTADVGENGRYEIVWRR